MRNYLFACLESEARLALLAFGLDPSLGVLHADQRNRDSLALDAMEPVRGDVDAFLLDLLEDRTFTARDFGELPNGVCRIAAPLTHELALTLPHWRGLVQPIAARLAQLFRNAAAGTNGKRPASVKSPLLATPRKAAQPRPYASKAWSTPRLETLPKSARRASYAATRAQAQAPALRRVHSASAPRSRPASHRSRSQGARSPSRGGQRSARERPSWAQARRGHFRAASPEPGLGARRSCRSRCGVVLREVVPKLDGYSLSQIAKATGLSLAACSRIRAGTRVPHPRHWQAFESLVATR